MNPNETFNRITITFRLVNLNVNSWCQMNVDINASLTAVWRSLFQRENLNVFVFGSRDACECAQPRQHRLHSHHPLWKINYVGNRVSTAAKWRCNAD